MFDKTEIHRGLEIAQALWGEVRFDSIPPSEILLVIEEASRRVALDRAHYEASGCCC